ncbi:hypothetical protein [Corynebacterium nuruki]|uniref:hypothetical protein n=1 Tax=Corynebacterium nuruki TaxID=1032851 RepID=UPI0039BFAE53
MIVLIVHGFLNEDISSLVVAVVLCAFTLMWFMTYLRNRRSKWSAPADMINGEYKLSPVNRLASYPSFISFFMVVVFVGWKMLGAADGVMSWRRKATTVLVVGCIGIVVYIAEALRPWKIRVTDDEVMLFRYGTVSRITRDSLSHPRGTSLQGVVVDGEMVAGKGTAGAPARCVVDFPLRGWKAVDATTAHTQV